MIVLPTSYFPNTQYCTLLKNSDQVTIDIGEHYIKQTIRSRTYILGANGMLKLIVPLVKWKNNTPVKDIRIAYDQKWQKLHWKSIESAYRSSPYFEYYEDKFRKPILETNHTFLVDLNLETMELLLQALDITCKINTSGDYVKAEKMEDYREVRTFLEAEPEIERTYIQVFAKDGFQSNLSYIDLICNEGPNALHLL